MKACLTNLNSLIALKKRKVQTHFATGTAHKSQNHKNCTKETAPMVPVTYCGFFRRNRTPYGCDFRIETAPLKEPHPFKVLSL